MIFLANPDSPTGSYIDEEYLRHLIGLAKRVGAILLRCSVDHFSPKPIDYNELIKGFENLIVIYSASKVGASGCKVRLFSFIHKIKSEVTQISPYVRNWELTSLYIREGFNKHSLSIQYKKSLIQ